MKYRVSVASQSSSGAEREVEITFAPSGEPLVTLDGKRIDAEVRKVPGGLTLRIGNRVHDIALSGRDEIDLAAGSARAVATIVNEKAARDAKRAGGASAKELRAPMPGRVVRMLVKKGDAVAAGQPLCVIEAMKMENELRATAAATVKDVLVREGESVESKASLITFE